MNKSATFLFMLAQLFIFKNTMSMYNSDRYNFSGETDKHNIVMQVPPALFEKNKDNLAKKDCVSVKHMPDKDAILIFKTHFLWKLLGPEQGIFNDYHCVPFVLIDLICKYGELTLDRKYKAANFPSHSCYGVYCKRFYNTLNVGSEEIVFGGGFNYQNRLASVVKDENGHIFHAGFHKVFDQANEQCLEITKNISSEIEKSMLLDSYKEAKVIPYTVDFNVHENVVPVHTIYRAPIIKSLDANKYLLIFPCPNNKDFFITTNEWILQYVNNC